MTVAASQIRRRILRVAFVGLAISIAAGVASPAMGFGGLDPRHHKSKRPAGRAPGAPQAAPQAPSAVAFVGLSDGQTVRRRTTFRVRLVNFTVCPTYAPTRLVPGQGFLHFSMDDGAFDVPGHSANGSQAVRAGTQGRYSPVRGTVLTYSGLPPGRHTLRVSLADNFHAETGVLTSVTFLVR